MWRRGQGLARSIEARIEVVLDPDKFRLSSAQHQAIFDLEIKSDLFSGALPSSKPVAIIFGGQPGAGKSLVVGLAKQDLGGRGGGVEIIGDKLRDFHPLYSRLVGLDDKTAAFYTDRDTGLWIEKAIAEASRLRVNIVIEGTMRDNAKVAETMKMLRSSGFEIEARALAVHHRLSEQGILMRYEGQKIDRGSARMTTRAAHQAGFDGLPITLARIESEKLADRVFVLRRGGEVIYENTLNAGAWAHPAQAREVLERERQRPLNTPELQAYAKAFDILAKQLAHPERSATPDEIAQVNTLRLQANNMLAQALQKDLTQAQVALAATEKALSHDRLHAFNTLSMQDALARHPELDGAYKLLHDARQAKGTEDTSLVKQLQDQIGNGKLPIAQVAASDSKMVIEHAAAHRGLSIQTPSPSSTTRHIQGEIVALSSGHALIKTQTEQALIVERQHIAKEPRIGESISVALGPTNSNNIDNSSQLGKQQGSQGREISR